MIHKYFACVVVLLLLPLLTHANEYKHLAQPTALELLVYKTPTCGCCKQWISHLNTHAIITHSKDLPNLGQIKTKYGIKPHYRSCHTAVTRNGFVFEGHVPAKFIQQFLSQPHADAIGLTVPAMPVGSPGMEVNEHFTPYKVLILFKDGTSQIYAKVNSYEEQF